MKLFRILLIVLLIFTSVHAQTITQTLRIQFDIEGPPAPAGGARPPFDATIAQSYLYKVYEVGTAIGFTLTGVQCTTTQDAFIKTCAATIPTAIGIPGKIVDMTVTINNIESAHSGQATIPPLIVPPTAPFNVKLLWVIPGVK